MENTFLVCTRNDSEASWLESSLSGLGKTIKSGDNMEEMFRLVELMGVTLVFMGIDRHNQVQQCSLIESLLEARPMLVVVALGDGYDSELVIAAMRAGARDFLTYGMRGSEVLGLVRRLTNRLPQVPARGEQGKVAFFFAAQADPDASFVAAHVALEMQKKGEEMLLLDLGIPVGESPAVLGLDCTFHFDDAMRNLRRLDSTVIDSAFARHGSGLRILPLLDDQPLVETCSSAELFLLLGTLRQNFSQVIINACGQRDCTAIRTLAGAADNLFWYTDQSVPCSRRNLALLDRWRSEGVRLDHAQLVVDRYIAGTAPDSKTLVRTYELPLAAVLPPSPACRLECRNAGRPLSDLAPRDALSKALIKLAGQAVATPSVGGLLQRIRRRA